MKKIYIIFLALFLHVFQILSLRADNLLYNLIVLLNHNQSEFQAPLNSDHVAITGTLAIALHEKANPILVSTSLKENFDSHYKNPENQKIVASIRAKKLTGEAFRATPEYNTVINPYTYAYPLIAYNPDDWFIYTHRSSDLLLFIPKSYATQKALEFEKKNLEQIEYAKELKDKLKSTQKAFENLPETKDLPPRDTITVEENPRTALKEEIFYFEQESKKIDLILENQKTLLNEAKTVDAQVLITCGFSPHEFIAGEPIMRDKPSTGIAAIVAEMSKTDTEPEKKPVKQRTIQALLSSLLTKEQTFGQWLFYLSGHGHGVDEIAGAFNSSQAIIADLVYKEFITLLKHLNNNIQTRALFYLTCSAGGYNRGFIEKGMQQENLNYYLIFVGASDVIVVPNQPDDFELSKSGIVTIKPIVSLDGYFKNLELFFNAPEKEDPKKEIKRPEKSKPTMLSDPFSKNLAPLLPADQIRNSNLQVFVRFPGLDKIFTPLQLNNKKIKFLTKNRVQALKMSHESSLDYREADLVFIETDAVLQTLRLGAKTALAYSKKGTPNLDKRVLFLAECSVPAELNQFIYNIVQFFGLYTTTICIKKLTVINNEKPIVYNNVIISGKSEETIAIRYTDQNFIPYLGQKYIYKSIARMNLYKPDELQKAIADITYAIDLSSEYTSPEKFNTFTKIEQYCSDSTVLRDLNDQLDILQKQPEVDEKAADRLTRNSNEAYKKHEISFFDTFLLDQKVLEFNNRTQILLITQFINPIIGIDNNIDIDRIATLTNYLKKLATEYTAKNISKKLYRQLKDSIEPRLLAYKTVVKEFEDKIIEIIKTSKTTDQNIPERLFLDMKYKKNSFDEIMMDKHQIARLLKMFTKSYANFLNQLTTINDYNDYFEYFCLSLKDSFLAQDISERDYTHYLALGKAKFLKIITDTKVPVLAHFITRRTELSKSYRKAMAKLMASFCNFSGRSRITDLQEFFEAFDDINITLKLYQPLTEAEAHNLSDSLKHAMIKAIWLVLTTLSYENLIDQENVQKISLNLNDIQSSGYITEKELGEIKNIFEKLQKFANNFKNKISVEVQLPENMLEYFVKLRTDTESAYFTIFREKVYKIRQDCLEIIDQKIKDVQEELDNPLGSCTIA